MTSGQHLSKPLATESFEPAASVRAQPAAWSSPLSSVPEPFREAILDGAWKLYDSVLAEVQNDPERTKGQETTTASATAAGHISYAAFLPYHLVSNEQMDEAKALLKEDLHGFLKWSRKTYPDADRLLVLGDAPKGAEFDEILTTQLAAHPAQALLCGPGKAIEPLLRYYGRERNYTTFHVASIDHEAQGASWDQMPGPKLDRMIQRIFEELKPNRVIAFDPVRMPATVTTLEECRKRGLPILYADSPTAVRKASP